MKVFKLVCFILFLSVTGPLVAQDIITLKDGREIKSKVIEIGSDVVKYKKADNLEGPTYTVTKAEMSKIKYANGSEEIMESSASEQKTTEEPSIFTGKFDIEDESTHDYLEGVAKNAGSRILSKCAGKVDNYSTEIYWDQTYRDEVTKEIVVAIVVKWEKGLEGKQRWVKGLVKLDKTGRKLWSYQGDGGINFSNCAKTLSEL